MMTSEDANNSSIPALSKEEKRRLKKEKKRKRKEALSIDRGSTSIGYDRDEEWAKGFEVQDLRVRVALLPRSLGSYGSVYNQAVQSVRKGLLFKYHQATGGIAIAFRTIELARDGKGWIRHELPHIHFTAEVQALVFCPKTEMEVCNYSSGIALYLNTLSISFLVVIYSVLMVYIHFGLYYPSFFSICDSS